MAYIKGLKIKFFSQRIDSSQNLKYGSLVIVDVKVSSLTVLRNKLWLKEHGNLHTDHLQYSFRYIHSNAQNLGQTLSCLNHNFICEIANLEILTGL